MLGPRWRRHQLCLRDHYLARASEEPPKGEALVSHCDSLWNKLKTGQLPDVDHVDCDVALGHAAKGRPNKHIQHIIA